MVRIFIGETYHKRTGRQRLGLIEEDFVGACKIRNRTAGWKLSVWKG